MFGPDGLGAQYILKTREPSQEMQAIEGLEQLGRFSR